MIRRQVDRPRIKIVADGIFHLALEHRQHAQRPEENAAVDVVGAECGQEFFTIERHAAVNDNRRHPVAVGRADRFGIHFQRQIAQVPCVVVEDPSLPAN